MEDSKKKQIFTLYVFFFNLYSFGLWYGYVLTRKLCYCRVSVGFSEVVSVHKWNL